MKRMIGCLLCLVLLLSVAGCKQQEVTTEDLLGTTTETAYQNDFFGVRFSLPEGWVFFGEEELKELSGMTSEAMANEDVKAALDTGAVRVAMHSMNASGLQSVNVNVSAQKNLSNAMIDHYMEETLQQTIPVMEQSGFTVTDGAIEEHEIMGKTVKVMVMHMEYLDTPYHTAAIFLVNDGYLATVTAASFHDDETIALLKRLERI